MKYVPEWLVRPAQPTFMQLPKEKMFDESGQWIHIETFGDFDNGLSVKSAYNSETCCVAAVTMKQRLLFDFSSAGITKKPSRPGW